MVSATMFPVYARVSTFVCAHNDPVGLRLLTVVSTGPSVLKDFT
ncbi:DUF3888 domain-containing protein [Deinococcus cavernae]|nr:DUF3888 domain-containing protein [Deinococcus cavernae]